MEVRIKAYNHGNGRQNNNRPPHRGETQELFDTLERAREKDKEDVNTFFARLRLIPLLIKKFSENILSRLFLIR